MEKMKKKSNCQTVIKNRKIRSFTLVEVIISTLILSIIALSSANVMGAFLKLEKKADLSGDNSIKNIFALNYIEKEIDSSEYLIPSNNLEFKAGFILLQREIGLKRSYKYVTFAAKDRILNRLAYNGKKLITNLHIERFAENKLLENIKAIEGNVDCESKLINLKLINMNDEIIEIKHYFRGKIIE